MRLSYIFYVTSSDAKELVVLFGRMGVEFELVRVMDNLRTIRAELTEDELLIAKLAVNALHIFGNKEGRLS